MNTTRTVSEKIERGHSIVDDPEYRSRQRQPLVPQFVQPSEGPPLYDPGAAYIAATASAWAYSDADALRSKLKDLMELDLRCWEFSACNPTMYLDTDAFFVRTDEPDYPKVGVLVFRGTQLTSVGDLLADALVEMRPFPHRGQQLGQLHGGFLEGAKTVWKRVYHMLVKNPVDHLIIAGHSLGAALAVVTAAQLFWEYELRRDERFDDVIRSLRGIYTFGQPAVGDADFAAWAEKTFAPLTFRHHYGNDVVPSLPTADVRTLYQHFVCGVSTCKRGEHEWQGLNDGREFPVARYFATTMGLSFADFVTRRLPLPIKTLDVAVKKMLPYSLDDHSPRNYLEVTESSYYRRRADTLPPPIPSARPPEASRQVAEAE